MLAGNQVNEKSEKTKTKTFKIKTDLPQVVNSLKQKREESEINEVITNHKDQKLNDIEDNKLPCSKITNKKKYSKHEKRNCQLIK